MHTTGLPNGNARAWGVGVWHLIVTNTLILLSDSEHTRRSPVHVLRCMCSAACTAEEAFRICQTTKRRRPCAELVLLYCSAAGLQ